MNHILLSLLVIFLSAQAAFAKPIQPLAAGDYALNMHFFWQKSKPTDLAEAAKFGVKVVRFDLPWRDVEKTKGEYDWSQYDPLFEQMRKLGIRPFVILGKPNPLHAPRPHQSWAPFTDDSRAAFTRYATAAAVRYAGYNPIFEIWNEPDTDRFWKPVNSSEDYLKLAVQSCQSIKKAVPTATVVGPGLSVIPNKENSYVSAHFMADLFESKPLMGCLDAFTVHPYRKKSPETFYYDVPNIEKVYKDSAQTTVTSTMPQLLVGEWGYSTFRHTPEKQADYAVRQQLVSLALNQPFSVIYNWRNEGTDPKEKEHNFGLRTYEDKTKPAYTYLANLRAFLKGSQVAGRLPTKEDVFALAFTVPGSKSMRYAIWTYSRYQQIPLTLPKNLPNPKITAVLASGKPVTLKPDRNNPTILKVPVTFTPLFITLTP